MSQVIPAILPHPDSTELRFMRAVRCLHPFLALLVALTLAACAQAPQVPMTVDYEPSVGQEGKDVVWVPSPDKLVEAMLDLAEVTEKDTVIDLGSGDGRTVIAAAKRGARALGVEYDADLVTLSRLRAQAAGVAGRASFVKQDLFKTDLSRATVITLFLLPSLNLELRPRLLALEPGTRVVSNTFDMDAWQPDDTVTLYEEEAECEAWCTALLWIVPAQLAGKHSLPEGELELEQNFQMLSGTLRSARAVHEVEGRVRGEAVEFRAGGKTYRGRVRGGKLELR
jgi:SAM-dependent methyltransferase